MHPKTPRLRMFAGPNGSGKSTIKEVVPHHLLGIYLNADDIEKQIKQDGIFHLNIYPINASAEEIIQYFQASAFLKAAGLHHQTEQIVVADNSVNFSAICNDYRFSYFSSVLVDFLRRQLLKNGISFTFETVMSSQDKVEFLRLAQTQGYRTYLYFVATIDPEINISRVENRVKLGGHGVAPDKIRDRYYRSLDYLIKAIEYADRAYIFDNSIGDKSVWLAEV